MSTLEQKNGRNWRRAAIYEDGIQYEISNLRTTSSQFLAFNRLGRRRNSDYTYTSNPEPQFTRNVMLLGIYGALALAFISESLSSHFHQKSSETLSIIFTVLGIISGLSIFVQLFIFNRKVTLKTIHFRNGGFMTVYCRNEKDRDQINAFEVAVDKAFIAVAVEDFKKALKSDPKNDDLKPWLEDLHEEDFITDKAYIKYKTQLKNTKTGKSNSRKKKT